ncbi:MAG: GntR family transcriptional regulator, partial [Balneolales bacterium]
DALFVPLQLMRNFREDSDNMLLLPMVYHLTSDMLISLVERSAISTLGVVAREERTLSVLIDELKLSLKFPGSILAGAVYGKSLPLFVREVDMVLYPPSVASLVERQIPDKRRMKLRYSIDARSAEIIRSELWDQ